MKLIIVFFCLVLLHAQHVEAQILAECSTTANFTTGSQFQRNLNLLLHSLLLNGSRDGYFNASIGTSSNTVFGLAQCRGDVSMDLCRTCLRNKTVEITQRCPIGMAAILHYDHCYVRYSNSNFFSQVDNSLRAYYNTGNISDAEIERFDYQLGVLLSNLSESASSKTTRYDSGTADYTNFGKLYTMVQCNRDLTPTGCLGCLRSMISWIPGCCDRKRGALIYSTTCHIRFETYPFLEAPPLYPPPPPPPPPVFISPPPPLTRNNTT